MSATLLLESEAAREEIRRAALDAFGAAARNHGDPVGRALDALGVQLGVLTLARTADLLGVSERTVTETYVARMGLPAHRTGRTSSPLFLLDELKAWVGGLDVTAPEGRASVVPLSSWEDRRSEDIPGPRLRLALVGVPDRKPEEA